MQSMRKSWVTSLRSLRWPESDLICVCNLPGLNERDLSRAQPSFRMSIFNCTDTELFLFTSVVGLFVCSAQFQRTQDPRSHCILMRALHSQYHTAWRDFWASPATCFIETFGVACCQVMQTLDLEGLTDHGSLATVCMAP